MYVSFIKFFCGALFGVVVFPPSFVSQDLCECSRIFPSREHKKGPQVEACWQFFSSSSWDTWSWGCASPSPPLSLSLTLFYELKVRLLRQKVFVFVLHTRERGIDTSIRCFEGNCCESCGNRENSFIDFAAELCCDSQESTIEERTTHVSLALYGEARGFSFILFVLRSLSRSPTQLNFFPLHVPHFGTYSTAPRRSGKSRVLSGKWRTYHGKLLPDNLISRQVHVDKKSNRRDRPQGSNSSTAKCKSFCAEPRRLSFPLLSHISLRLVFFSSLFHS